jgi:putative ABC transport system permease protein
MPQRTLPAKPRRRATGVQFTEYNDPGCGRRPATTPRLIPPTPVRGRTAMVIAVGFLVGLLVVAFLALIPFFALLLLGEALLKTLPAGRGLRFLLMIFKNLRRNLVRTSLTYLATFVLVAIVTQVWSVLYYLDSFTAERAKAPKLIIQEKWQANSQMPFAYAASLEKGAASRPGDVLPQDAMTWQFYLGTVDPAKQTRDSLVPCIAMEPRKCLTMMDDLWDELTTDQGKHRRRMGPEQRRLLEECVYKLEGTKNGMIVSTAVRLALNKKVGERLKLTGINFKGLDLEFDILGEFPGGRFSGLAVINRDYLNDALDRYPQTHGRVPHPLADRSLALVWLAAPDNQAVGRLAGQIESSPMYTNPAVKCETLSAGMAALVDSYRDLIWGMRWLLSPAILFTMTLVLANAIGISVRERRAELAVLKVLGFRPAQVLALVLGEGVLIGAVSGLLSAALTYLIINQVANNNGYFELGIYVPLWGLAWGPVVGALAALAGSLLPAWSSCRMRVTEVFARVA